MNSNQLKNNILEKINQIEDEVLLGYVQDFLLAADKYYSKKPEELDLTQDEESEDMIDFTDYIKEWIKDM